MATSYERVQSLASKLGLQGAQTDLTSAQADFTRGPRTDYITAQTEYMKGPQTEMTRAQADYTGQLTEGQKIKNRYNKDMNPIRLEVAENMLGQWYADEGLREAQRKHQFWTAKKGESEAKAFADWYNADQQNAIAAAQYTITQNKLKLSHAQMTSMAGVNFAELEGINNMLNMPDDPTTDVDESIISPQTYDLAGQVWQQFLGRMHNEYGEPMPQDHPNYNPQAPDQTIIMDEEGNEINFPGLPTLGQKFNANHIAGLNVTTGQFKAMSEFGQRLMLGEKQLEAANLYADLLKQERAGQQNVAGSLDILQQLGDAIGVSFTAGWGAYYTKDQDGAPLIDDKSSAAQNALYPQFATAYDGVSNAVSNILTNNPKIPRQYAPQIADMLTKLITNQFSVAEDYSLSDDTLGFGDNITSLLPTDTKDREDFDKSLFELHPKSDNFKTQTPMEWYQERGYTRQQTVDEIISIMIRQEIQKQQPNVAKQFKAFTGSIK